LSRLATSFVLGYHGCDKDVGLHAINGDSALIQSDKAFDWLGPGTYFWESDPRRALEWAQSKAGRGEYREPYVIGAVIDLGNCLDLVSREDLELLGEAYNSFSEMHRLSGAPTPKLSTWPRCWCCTQATRRRVDPTPTCHHAPPVCEGRRFAFEVARASQLVTHAARFIRARTRGGYGGLRRKTVRIFVCNDFKGLQTTVRIICSAFPIKRTTVRMNDIKGLQVSARKISEPCGPCGRITAPPLGRMRPCSRGVF